MINGIIHKQFVLGCLFLLVYPQLLRNLWGAFFHTIDFPLILNKFLRACCPELWQVSAYVSVWLSEQYVALIKQLFPVSVCAESTLE